ncbi:MAG TPA: hypothetical protein DDZ80_27465 [Cyanobacteria bacterium UBA8803]|nr:hypothetical protein [Cyanobacteria bacterium UBA9273]HBL62011.1 hypothetical protein [Cyanobacteria bacterium UBA8803]
MNDFLNLSREYLEAGETLYQQGKRSRPVAFCYIQSAELLLKGLAQRQGILSESLRKTHDLLALWGSLHESQDKLISLIEELSSIDPKTTRFRYPAQEKEFWDLDYIRDRVLKLHDTDY